MLNHKQLSKKEGSSLVPDIILGGQDGLVNVLGVLLGLAAATTDTQIIIAGGLAATFAESISMAAVAMTSKIAERDHFLAQLKSEEEQVKVNPKEEEEEIRLIYTQRGFEGEILDKIVDHITNDKRVWIDSMMKEELESKNIEIKEIHQRTVIIGLSAFVGSIIPVIPYFVLPPKFAIWITLILSATILFIVGFIKAKLTIGKPYKSGLEIASIGMGAALVGYLIGLIFAS